MQKKTRIWMLITTLIFIMLLSNLSAVRADTREWNAGDVYNWGFKDSQILNWYNLDRELSSVEEDLDADDIVINITSIDTLSEIYQYIRSDVDNINSESTRSYDSEDFVDDVLEFGDLIDADYDFDRSTNTTVLVDIDLELPNVERWFLIEPDWVTVNEGFKELYNKSEIIASVDDYYNGSLTYNFTLGDLYDSAASYRLMGKRSFDSGVEQFVETNKWTISFDFSGVLGYPRFNSTAGYFYYVLYEKYEISLDFEFTTGGILRSYTETLETQITYNDIVYEREEIIEYALGGIRSVTAPIPIASVISGLFLTSIATIVIKKKRK